MRQNGQNKQKTQYGDRSMRQADGETHLECERGRGRAMNANVGDAGVIRQHGKAQYGERAKRSDKIPANF